MMNRRNLLAKASAVAALSVTAPSFAAPARPKTRDMLVFDAMGEMRTNYTPELISEIRDSGLDAITVTLTDPKAYEARAYDEALAAIAEHDAFIAANPQFFIKGLKTADLGRARAQNKIAVYYLFQNSAQFGRDLSRVRAFYDAGVRSSQLTYNYQNWAGSGCKEKNGSGVTRFGGELIDAMNEIGMLIDLSHANDATTLGAIERTAKPVIVLHTCCMAVYKNERNISDEALKALADKGGVVGVCQIRPFITDKRPDVALPDYFAHIDHAVKIAGVDHVAIGSDRDHRVIVMTDEYLEEIAREEGENFNMADWPLFIDALNGPRRMEVIWDGLIQRGYKTRDAEKIMGLNLKRLYGEVIG